MLTVHPLARLAAAILMCIGIVLTSNLAPLGMVYSGILLAMLGFKLGRTHARFALVVSLPILLALLLIWGWVADPAKIPAPHPNGIEYAFFSWLRIVAFAGIFQMLFLPLLANPLHFRGFLHTIGFRGAGGVLVTTALLFVPEIGRRFIQIRDARRARGFQITGLTGLRHVPTMLMPLVASLMDSALTRSELWQHRGLTYQSLARPDLVYSPIISGALVSVVGIFNGAMVWIWR